MSLLIYLFLKAFEKPNELLQLIFTVCIKKAGRNFIK